MNPRIRVLIVDDHAVVREGLMMFLSEQSNGIEVVGEAVDGAEAVEKAQSLKPDVVLMDLAMPRVDGVEATRRLREAGTPCRVLVLTSFADDQRVRDAIQAGATGYLLKDVLRDDLLEGIRDAARGTPRLHPEAQRQLMRHVSMPPQPSLLDTLTDREGEVLDLIASGLSNKEIAARLFLTTGTVKGHVSAILSKLGLADRTQAALYAARHGLGPTADE